MDAQSNVRQVYDSVFGGDSNLGTGERIVSTGLGIAMAAGGVRKGASLPGALMGLAGAYLVARGMSGHCPLKSALAGEGRSRIGGDRNERLAGAAEHREEMERPVSTQAI